MYRSYLIYSEKHHGCYCGKCGKRILQDSYNYKKHAVVCGFADSYDVVAPVSENVSQGYLLENKNGDLVLSVCEPRLRLINGFSDRFRGTDWISHFRAVYKPESRNITLEQNDLGISLDILLKLISEGKLYPVHQDRDVEVIHSVFPSVFDVHSLYMFSYIFSHKGFRHVEIIPPHLKRKLYCDIPAEIYQKDTFHEKSRKSDTAPCCFGLATIHRFRGQYYFLRIILRDESDKPLVLIFSRDYCACSRLPDLRELLGKRIIWHQDSLDVIRSFGQQYPEYTLSQYMNTSNQVLFPLLSGNYHLILELAAKAGLCSLAENYTHLKEFKVDPSDVSNIQNLFHLPVSILRKIPYGEIENDQISRVREVYGYNPNYISSFDHLTLDQISFMMNADIAHDGRNYRLYNSSQLSPHQVLSILRYLERHTFSHLYRDYLELCILLNDYSIGFAPDDIQIAHDHMVDLYLDRQNDLENKAFLAAIRRDDYCRLTTTWKEEDQETTLFDNDPYMIISPILSTDLETESRNMHNCVRTYKNAVTHNRTKIYFLRAVSEPDKSLGTIEVGNDNHLVQAKAFGNRILPEKEQLFILKWCMVKNIAINRCRDITVSSS